MKTIYLWYDEEEARFKTVSEFKDSVNYGAEINFEWKGREYHICPVWPNGEAKYCIAPLDTLENTVYNNADEMLEYRLDGDRLGDVVTQLVVCDRTL